MLIEWMAYAALLASIVFIAAAAAERIVAIWNGGQRFIWIVSLLIATIIPVVLATRPSARVATPPVAQPSSAGTTATGTGVMRYRPTTPTFSQVVRARATSVLSSADPYLRRGWIVASVICLVVFGRAAIGVRRQRMRWRPVDLDGLSVLVAPNVGPAVIGALRPDVVIPEWALLLDRQARALMLRHEREHIRARDPLLLFVAGIAVALFPWNPALWMLVRRLRLAIEIDCDRRVLGASSQQHEYGLLLLTVGARNSTSLPFATSLAERRPFLERRIRAMTSARPRHPRTVSLVCLGLTVIASTAAVRAPRPQSLAMQQAPAHVVAPVAAPAVVPQVASTPVIAPALAPSARPAVAVDPIVGQVIAPAPRATATPRRAGEPIPDEVIRALIARYYPGVLRGESNINVISFVFDANGNYVFSTADYLAQNAGKDVYRFRAGSDSNRVVELKQAVEGSYRSDATMDEMKRAEEAKYAKMTAEYGDAPIAIKAQADSEKVFIMLKEKRAVEARYSNLVADTISVLTNITPNGGVMSNLVDPKTIESVEVRKFPEGRMSPLPLGVIIVQLKPAGQ